MKRKLESIMDCSDKFDRQITILGEKSDPELVSIHRNSSVTTSKFSVLVSYFKSHFDKIMTNRATETGLFFYFSRATEENPSFCPLLLHL